MYDFNSVAWQLGLLKNIEREMGYGDDKPRPYNWVLVKNFMLGHTNKGGRTSSCVYCEKLGLDPYGYDLSIKGIPRKVKVMACRAYNSKDYPFSKNLKNGSFSLYPSSEALDKDIWQPHHLYFVGEKDSSLEIGDWCMFYGQPSKVLDIEGSIAKIKTHSNMSKEDAEFINECKGKIVAKENDESTMVHSFSSSSLPKIIASTDKRLDNYIENEKGEGADEIFLKISQSFVKEYALAKGEIYWVVIEYRVNELGGESPIVEANNNEVIVSKIIEHENN